MLQIATSRPSFIRYDDKCINKISTAICDYGRNKAILIKWEQRRRPKYNAGLLTTNIRIGNNVNIIYNCIEKWRDNKFMLKFLNTDHSF